MARIVFVGTMNGATWGGSEELWSSTARKMLAKGHDVRAVVNWWPTESCKVTALERSGCPIRRWRSDLRHKILRRLTGAEARWCEAFNPGLVVISQGEISDGLWWMRKCRSKHIRYAVIVQSNDANYWPRDEERRRDLSLHYEAAVACYFVSRTSLELLRVQLATDLSRAVIIRNPFNVPFQDPLSWPAADTVLSLACVGRLELRTKGQDILFKVLSQPKWQNRPVRVDLFGDGPHAETLRLLARKYELRNVAFRGRSDNIAEIWRTHHVLIQPSRIESMPLVVVEAMLCGRPCVVTDVGGISELVEDGISGIIAPFPTPGAIDAALERAWERRGDLEKMGLEAARRVRALVPPDPAEEFATKLAQFLA